MASIFDEVAAITPKINYFKALRGDDGEGDPVFKFRVYGRKQWFTIPWDKTSTATRQAAAALQAGIKADYQAIEQEGE